MKVQKRLQEFKDAQNAEFQAKLAPTVNKKTCLGVRVPIMRKIEKEFRDTKEAEVFINSLPHKYFDENLLHSVFISNLKDYDAVIIQLEKFLPYVDNWSVCDTLRPIVFKKNKTGLIEKIKEWISSSEIYVCRFGVNILMSFFLDENFKTEYLKLPAKIHSDEYYINMMIAWFYATALAKHWDETIPYIEKNKLGTWVHNKTIQKAIESYRITDEQKLYLRTLKRK